MSNYESTPTPVSDNWFSSYVPADDEEKCHECQSIVWAPKFEEHRERCAGLPMRREQ